MPGVFRRRWFPRPKRNIGLAIKNANLLLDSVVSTTQVGSFSVTYDKPVSGVSATAQVQSPTPNVSEFPNGVSATTGFGAFAYAYAVETVVGQQGIAQISDFSILENNNPNLTGVTAFAQAGIAAGDHPSDFLNGVFATTQFENLLQQIPWPIFGLQVNTIIPDHPFFESPQTLLAGLTVHALSWGAAGAGGGGGGAAGIYGPGQRGFDGASSGDGGHGGYADGGTTPGANTTGAPGADGDELDPGHLVGFFGAGSGGAGANFDGAVGNFMYNENGSVFISYKSSITGSLKFLVLTIANNGSPFIIPNDWTNSNVFSLVGAGCVTHGDNVVIGDLTAYSPGDAITFHVAAFCENAPTTWDIYSAASGQTIALVGGQGGDGGVYGGGGGGGTGGGGGMGGNGLIFLQYRSSLDSTIKTVILLVGDNGNSPFTMPADWTSSNFVYLSGSGGCGGVGTISQGGNGGGGGGINGAYDTNVFLPGQVVPYFVSPGCSGLPTIFGQFAAESGQNGDTEPSSFSAFDQIIFVLPCGSSASGDGGSGDGSVGPPRLVE